MRECLIQDGSFSRSSMIQRINGDLANDFGNLVQRILAMVAKNCAGQVPNPAPLLEDDLALMDMAKQANVKMRQAMNDIAIHKMLEYIWQVVGAANRYIDMQAPWQLKKQDPERMATVLYVGADVIHILHYTCTNHAKFGGQSSIYSISINLRAILATLIMRSNYGNCRHQRRSRFVNK